MALEPSFDLIATVAALLDKLHLGARYPSGLHGGVPAAAFDSYVEERRERMRRLRLCARLDAVIHAEFGPQAQRRREVLRARRAADPSFLACQAAVMLGPEKLPAALFDERLEQELTGLR
jgi:hypothetical protein